MTPNQLRKQIALLKKEGINRVIYDVLKEYEEGRWATDLTEVALQIVGLLSVRYKEQLPKKVVKVKQVDLEDSIAEKEQI